MCPFCKCSLTHSLLYECVYIVLLHDAMHAPVGSLWKELGKATLPLYSSSVHLSSSQEGPGCYRPEKPQQGCWKHAPAGQSGCFLGHWADWSCPGTGSIRWVSAELQHSALNFYSEVVKSRALANCRLRLHDILFASNQHLFSNVGSVCHGWFVSTMNACEQGIAFLCLEISCRTSFAFHEHYEWQHYVREIVLGFSLIEEV